MSGVELTVTAPCATCGGTGIAERIVPEPTLGNGSTFITVCWDCNGTGVNRTTVTCAGCRWFSAEQWTDTISEIAGWGTCERTQSKYGGQNTAMVWGEFDEDSLMVSPEHGCVSWTAKEATGNGNG